MLYYLYCSMPGSKWQRITLTVASILVILAVVFFVVFPLVAPLMEPDMLVYRD